MNENQFEKRKKQGVRLLLRKNLEKRKISKKQKKDIFLRIKFKDTRKF